MNPDDPRLAQLKDFLAIPSVSADPKHAEDIARAARWVAEHVRESGGRAEILSTQRQPLVVGEMAANAPQSGDRPPTVLVYGHYDVQPLGGLGEWVSPPFEPQVRDGWIFGRGTADDKGPFFALLTAARELAQAGQLPVNVRIVSDGEEEILGDSVVRYLAQDDQPADACLIFDGPMARQGQPTFVMGMRGLVSFHLDLTTGSTDLHSGFYGGAALNAAHAMVTLLAEASGRADELTLDVEPPTEDELANWDQLDDGVALLHRQGARPADGAAADEFHQRTLARPSFEVHGIRSGEALLQNTAIPVEAMANVSVRLVPHQSPERVASTLTRILHESAPDGADLTIQPGASTPPVLMGSDSPVIEIAGRAFERAFGVAPLRVRSGGTLPIMGALAARAIPTVLTGLALHESRAHGPNERLPLENLSQGIDAAKDTLVGLADLASDGVPGS